MSKIYIVGIVASGKTTLAKALSAQLGIPWYELDSVVHIYSKQAHYKRTPEEQADEINRINDTGDWIMEGTYRKSCHCLFELADHIIFLDTPLWKRKCRIFTRFIKQQLKIEMCNYRSDLHMLRLMYKWTYEFERDRPQFLDMLKNYQDKLIVISKPSELKSVDKVRG